MTTTIQDLFARYLEQQALRPNNGKDSAKAFVGHYGYRMGYLNIPDDMLSYAGNGLLVSLAQGQISVASRNIETLTTRVKLLHPEFEEMPDPTATPPTYKILAVPEGQVFLDSNQQVHYEKE